MWPSASQLERAKVGQQLPIVEVAQSVVDSQGEYVLTIPSETALKYFPLGELVDVEITIDHPTGTVKHFFTAESKPNGLSQKNAQTTGSISVVDASESGELTPTRVDFSGTTGAVEAKSLSHPQESLPRTEDLEVATPQPNPASDATTLATTVPGVGIKGSCPGGSGLKVDLGNRKVLVGTINSKTAKSVQKFTFKSGGTSTLGAGVSLTGQSVGYSASGSVTRSAAITNSWGEYKGVQNLYLETTYSYGIFCSSWTHTAYGNLHSYTTRAIGHEGGKTVKTAPSVTASATNCSPLVASSVFDNLTSSTATTWTNGASLKGDIGIDLSARSGFTSSVSNSWRSTGTTRICGVNGKVSSSPGRITLQD